VKRRALLRSVSAARGVGRETELGADTVHELRVYHVAPGKSDALLVAFATTP